MKYFYYPGCSLEDTAAEYDASTRAVMRTLGAELIELEDWTCCGASAADAISELLSVVLPARNLAIAQRTGIEADFLIPCSACYLNMRKVDERMRSDSRLPGLINEAIEEEGLKYTGGMNARHLLDVLATDIGPAGIRAKVARSLDGLRVAPYYGCQALRPYVVFDHPERPRSMELLIEALGATVHSWPMGGKCCGAGLMTTEKDLALKLTGSILAAARGADCIVTVCPMCQMNLDSYQSKVSRRRGEDLTISVLYLPQLIGLALGLEEDLKLEMNLAFTAALRDRLYSAHSASA